MPHTSEGCFCYINDILSPAGVAYPVSSLCSYAVPVVMQDVSTECTNINKNSFLFSLADRTCPVQDAVMAEDWAVQQDVPVKYLQMTSTLRALLSGLT